MIDTPRILDTPAQAIAVLPITCTWAQMQQVMDPAIRELFSALQAQGIQPQGRWFTHHLRAPTQTLEFHVGVAVDRPVTAVGRVQPGQRPALKVARTVYHGGYEGLGGAWPQLHAWIQAQGLQGAAEFWETYLVDPALSPDPSQWQTQLEKPLRS